MCLICTDRKLKSQAIVPINDIGLNAIPSLIAICVNAVKTIDNVKLVLNGYNFDRGHLNPFRN